MTASVKSGESGPRENQEARGRVGAVREGDGVVGEVVGGGGRVGKDEDDDDEDDEEELGRAGGGGPG